MPIYKGNISKNGNILLPSSSTEYILQNVNIVNTSSNTNFINIYLTEFAAFGNLKKFQISIFPTPIKLKQGEAYIRDLALRIDANTRIFISGTESLDYYIVTTP